MTEHHKICSLSGFKRRCSTRKAVGVSVDLVSVVANLSCPHSTRESILVCMHVNVIHMCMHVQIIHMCIHVHVIHMCIHVQVIHMCMHVQVIHICAYTVTIVPSCYPGTACPPSSAWSTRG